ncbi:MAG: hypothetical protein AAGD96_30225 [Chloroflexota bacterium]
MANTLKHLKDILSTSVSGPLSAIHGGLNLENIIYAYQEPYYANKPEFIDFADARYDLCVHDFQRLESNIWLHAVSHSMWKIDQNSTLTEEKICYLQRLFDWLHNNQLQQAPSKKFGSSQAEKPAVLLLALRSMLFNHYQIRVSVQDYYRGLFLYLVGSLKFRNLDARHPYAPLPKQVAILSASFIAEKIFPQFRAESGSKLHALRSDDDGDTLNSASSELEQLTSLQIKHVIRENFSIADMKDIVDDLGDKFEEITSDKVNLVEIALYVVDYYERRNELNSLSSLRYSKNPNIDWASYLETD